VVEIVEGTEEEEGIEAGIGRQIWNPRGYLGMMRTVGVRTCTYTLLISPYLGSRRLNEGHKLLRQMGWQEGSGLGAERGGVLDPIREVVKKDMTGIGSTTGGSVPSNKYSSNQQRPSSEYRARIGGEG
jgi:G-patch domain